MQSFPGRLGEGDGPKAADGQPMIVLHGTAAEWTNSGLGDARIARQWRKFMIKLARRIASMVCPVRERVA